MKGSDDLKRGIEDVREAVTRVVHEATGDRGHGSHINVARRTNIKIAKNIGHDGSAAHASAIQDAPIIQDGTGAGEEGTDNSRPSE